MLNYTLTTTHLKRALNLLFHHETFSRYIYYEPNHEPNHNDELCISRYKPDGDNKEAIECPVCLCKLEEGDEIRELKCNHLFHKYCLDRWLGYRCKTCPLCRDYLAPRRIDAELGEEVLLFKFNFISSSYRRKWWIR